MNRWLYSYRAVSGDPAGLAGRLRGDLHGLLAAGTASTPPAPAGDGSFRMHLAVQVLGAELTKAVRVTTGVATVHGTRLGRPADHLCVEQQQRGGAQHGALVGVLSEADLMEKEARPATDLGRGVTEAWRLRGAMTVGEACSRPAHVTAADATLRDAVRELIDHGVARLVVVDGSRIAGILTRHDVLAALVRTDEVVKHTVDAVLQRQDEPDVTAMVEWGVITLSGTAARRSRIPGLIAQVEAIDGVMGVDADRLGYRDDDVLPVGMPFV